MSICRLSKKNERALLLKLDRLKGIFFLIQMPNFWKMTI